MLGYPRSDLGCAHGGLPLTVQGFIGLWLFVQRPHDRLPGAAHAYHLSARGGNRGVIKHTRPRRHSKHTWETEHAVVTARTSLPLVHTKARQNAPAPHRRASTVDPSCLRVCGVAGCSAGCSAAYAACAVLRAVRGAVRCTRHVRCVR